MVTSQNEVQTQLGTLKGRFSYPCRNGCPANVLIRPEDIIHDDTSPYKTQIIRKNFRGANILYTLLLQNEESVLALVSSHHNHSIDPEIGVKPQVNDIVLFEA